MKNTILIDPINETLTEVKVDTLEDIYSMLDVELIQVGHYLPNGDVIYVDEEALLKSTPINKAFFYGESRTPLLGKGLIIGTGKDGDSVSCLTTMDEAEQQVRIVSVAFKN